MLLAPRRESLEQRRVRHVRIAKRYSDGDPIEEIASDEGVNRKTVRNVARRAGLPLRNPSRSERNARIVAGYKEGRRVKELAEAEGCSSSYVSDVLSKEGVSRRPDRRLYSIDEAAFDHPDPTGWWLIGLLAADGCVNGRHGVVPRKTRSLMFSDEASAKAAVWLGLLDGDGCVGPAFNHGRPRIDLFGTRAVIEQCSTFWGGKLKLTLTTGRNPAVVPHAGGLWKVSLYGANAAKAARLMLSSSPVSMQRKRRTLEVIGRADRPVTVGDLDEKRRKDHG